MVSPLWKACAEGDLEKVQALLNDSPSPDVEIKDHTGVTPLICAVQNGHTEIVRLLLAKGADPSNVSSQGSPESYTSDQAILDLLVAAKNKIEPNGHQSESGYPSDATDPTKTYYPPPPGPYYYPGMPVPPPVHPDGSIAYYPPPHPSADHNGGLPNLPPPDIARMIPCRYFPACRYGTSCIFAHPQTPYLQGPLPPPAQYPAPFEHMTPAPYPSYYAVPQHAFPPPPNGAPTNPVSPPLANPPPLAQPPVAHSRSGSELVSPIQAPFSPSGVPPPVPYPIVSPVSPTYGHPGPMPIPVPVPPIPSLQHPVGPQSPPHAAYVPTSPTAPGPLPPHYIVRRDSVGQQYQPQGIFPNGTVDAVTSPKSPPLHSQADGFGPGPMNREAMTHHRRGSARRPSFGGLGRVKPPCLFFPSGRCRNGVDCRFPHILPDGVVEHHPHPHPHHFSNRGGHRPRPPPHVNGIAVIEDKFATLNVHEEPQAIPNNTQPNGASDGSSRSQSTEPGSKGRGYQGFRPPFATSPARLDKRTPVAPKPQRVPSADEFPVLGGGSGGITPPLRVNGPTAAQVLQAPAPSRSQPGTRGGSPENVTPNQNAKESRIEPNGTSGGAAAQDSVISKLTVSFATIAASDVVKEVSVTA